MDWFQIAVARGGLGDIAGSIEAYKSALDLNPQYDLAWFNLGGQYWNNGNVEQAAAVWRDAIVRFPEHELAVKVRQEFGDLVGRG